MLSSVRSGTRKWWALAGIMLSVLAVGLDATLLSVALPTLAGELHASESELQWFSSGYMLVLAALMLPAGLLGDRFGRKRVLMIGLAVFIAGSAACAFARTAEEFLLARLVLGVAGAGLLVMAISGLTVLFDERERPRAVGVWAAVNFLSLPLGPILAGWLLTRYWWGWIFLINVPVGIVGLIAAGLLVPESRARRRPGLDPCGVLTSAAGMTGLTYGLIEAGRNGWADPTALAAMVTGLVLLVAFFGWERRLDRRPGGRPMIDPGLFGFRSFTWGVILTAGGFMAMVGLVFTLPQYFQGVLGTDAMGSGLRLLPLIGGLAVGALPADRIARLAGAKATAALGFAMLATGLALAAGTGVRTGGGYLAIWMVVTGVGIGLASATTGSAALSPLSAERSGVGSAMMQALQKLGGPLGVAVLGSIASTGYRGRLDLAGLPPEAAKLAGDSLFGGTEVARELGSGELLAAVRAAFVHGMDLALAASAGIAAASIVLALVFLPGRGTGAEQAETVPKERTGVLTR